MSAWYVYMVRCRDGALYTGVATDVERRIREHAGADGKGAKSLRGRGPFRLVFSQPAGDRSEAQRVERRVKRLSKVEKEALAAGGAAGAGGEGALAGAAGVEPPRAEIPSPSDPGAVQPPRGPRRKARRPPRTSR